MRGVVVRGGGRRCQTPEAPLDGAAAAGADHDRRRAASRGAGSLPVNGRSSASNPRSSAATTRRRCRPCSSSSSIQTAWRRRSRGRTWRQLSRARRSRRRWQSHSIFGRISPQQKQSHRGGRCGTRDASWRWWGTARTTYTPCARRMSPWRWSRARRRRAAVAGIVLVRDSFSALIRGAQEATFVLGNSARLSKLFVAKSVYAYLLIFATNLLGLEFPFLPRHGSLTAMLALGIPAIFISISIPPPQAGKDYLNERAPLRPAGGHLARDRGDARAGLRGVARSTRARRSRAHWCRW